MSSFTMGPSANALAPKFERTISSLADCYLSDVDSAYQQLKENGADGYDASIGRIKPHLFGSERPIDSLLCGGHRRQGRGVGPCAASRWLGGAEPNRAWVRSTIARLTS
jgi:hypothetical protein